MRYIIARTTTHAKTTAEVDWGFKRLGGHHWIDHDGIEVRYVNDAQYWRGYSSPHYVYFGHQWEYRNDARQIIEMLKMDLIEKLPAPDTPQLRIK